MRAGSASRAQPWWQRWWQRIHDAISHRAGPSVPKQDVRARWAGGDAAAAAADRACRAAPGPLGPETIARRGARWLPFLPLWSRAPAAERAVEAAALQELHSVSAQARRSSEPSGAGATGAGASAGGADGLHLVDLSQAGDLGPGLDPDASTKALTAAAAAQTRGAAERAAVGSLQAQVVRGPCEPVLERGPGPAVAGVGMRAALVGGSEPALAGGAGARAGKGLAVARGARGEPVLAPGFPGGEGAGAAGWPAEALGNDSGPWAPDFPGGEGAGAQGLSAEALGDDSGPWAPFNESGLVPEVPPAIMWLIQEAEARPTPTRCWFLLR